MMTRVEAREAEFEVLKQRLLLHRLDQTSSMECHPFIIREADRAVELASRTAFPLLVYPCLFEELASKALEFHRERAGHYWRGFAEAKLLAVG